jgi:hypothetical protein
MAAENCVKYLLISKHWQLIGFSTEKSATVGNITERLEIHHGGFKIEAIER